MFKNENLPFRINIPSFQYSIIPCPPASLERPSASAEALRCRAGLAMAGRCEAEDQASKNSFVLNKLYNFRDVKLYSVIYEVREDMYGEYYHLVTLWKSTKLEEKLYEQNS